MALENARHQGLEKGAEALIRRPRNEETPAGRRSQRGLWGIELVNPRHFATRPRRFCRGQGGTVGLTGVRGSIRAPVYD